VGGAAKIGRSTACQADRRWDPTPINSHRSICHDIRVLLACYIDVFRTVSWLQAGVGGRLIRSAAPLKCSAAPVERPLAACHARQKESPGSTERKPPALRKSRRMHEKITSASGLIERRPDGVTPVCSHAVYRAAVKAPASRQPLTASSQSHRSAGWLSLITSSKVYNAWQPLYATSSRGDPHRRTCDRHAPDVARSASNIRPRI